ncbi:MAG: TetR/AcrR family transcriptional regulator [Chloroflexota bacterium]|jgi:AcrR family transcriptional regulator
MEDLSPRERRQARTREEILAAAMSLINEKGPDEFSLRGLAERVDYSPAGLYEYFDGKDDIINAVCAEGDLMLRDSLRAVPDTLPTGEYLVELGLAYIRFADQHMEHFKLMFTYERQGPPVPYEELEFDETYRLLLDAVQAGIDAGKISTGPSYGLAEVALGLWATAHGLAMLKMSNLRHVEYDFETANRAILERLVRGLT